MSIMTLFFKNRKKLDSQSFYSVFSDFIKWSARESATGTKQKSQQDLADTSQAKRDVPDVRFLSIGMESIVHAVDWSLEQNPKAHK